MIKTSMLILDKRKELGTKYKKCCEKLVSSVFLESESDKAFNIIEKNSPDLILISESFENSLKELTQKIKLYSENYRPTIVYISKSSQIEDKLNALENGADDYLSEPIQIEEMKARIKAHFRRIIESHLSPLTNLYDNKLSMLVLKRALGEEKNYAALLVTLRNFDAYKETYGTLAANKMLQTYAAIISSSLTDADFLGELAESEFLIITSCEKAEKIAAYLVFAYDSISEKFYNEKDAKNRYIIRKNSSSVEEKVGLVRTKIAVVKNEQKKYTELKHILSELLATLKLSYRQKKSSYAVDRLMFPVNESVETLKYNDMVCIIEPDDSLNLLLSTTSQIQGYKTVQYDYNDDVEKLFMSEQPSVLILDMGDKESKQGLDICRRIKMNKLLANTKIILTSNIRNKEEIMNAGADLYLPKPYDMVTIYSWVAKLMKEFNY